MHFLFYSLKTCRVKRDEQFLRVIRLILLDGEFIYAYCQYVLLAHTSEEYYKCLYIHHKTLFAISFSDFYFTF